MLQVVLVDDHPVVREGLRSLLAKDSCLKVVGEADNGLQALRLVERFRPSLVIMDILLPDLDGLKAIRQVVKRSPATRILVFSMISNEGCVLESLRWGGSAYVLKSSPPKEFFQALKEVIAGRRFLASALSQRAFDLYVHFSLPLGSVNASRAGNCSSCGRGLSQQGMIFSTLSTK